VTPALAFASLSLGIWLYLILFHGGFWLARERDDREQSAPPVYSDWPRVAVVIPARNEAEMLPRTLASLASQNYPGELSIIVVDDESSDGTAEVVRSMVARASREVTVLRGKPLPPAWTGKVWAMNQGVTHAEAKYEPDYLVLTDADIEYPPGALTRLVVQARATGNALTSLMVKLNCQSLAERALIPAFVFFFQMLYPFAWVNRSAATIAAAAGGCMLVDRRALARAGGMATIRGVLIDDCALAQQLKAEGPIWIGLSSNVRSLRSYPHFGDIRRMVARSAYAQLRYSPLLLAVATIGMAATYLAAPILVTVGGYPANVIAFVAWALMALAFLPILRFYRVSPLWGAALPLIAVAYLAFTLDSTYQYWHGRGGQWKGRSQAFAEKR